MTLGVPKTKGVSFATELFAAVSNELMELKEETGKWPDSISFNGPLGKEIYDFIMEAEWDFAKFGPKLVGDVVNRVRVEYSKPVDQVEDRGGTILDQSFNERKVSGIPGPETMAKIVSVYSAPAFTIQRQVRPYREIRLKRC